ncbi:MAG TPA: methyl-accepting chemotaxis protein [Burkholderiaceae bacterium]
MKFLNALTVRGKLSFAFGSVLVLMMLLGGFAVLQLSRVHGHTEALLNDRLPGVRDSLRMAEAATRYRVREYRLLISTKEELANAVDRMAKGRDDFETAQKSYARNIDSDAERKLYEQAVAGWKSYVEALSQALPLMQAGKAEAARELVSGADGLKRFDAMVAGVKKLAEYNDLQAKDDSARSDQAFSEGRLGVLGSMAAALVCAIGLGWLISRAISEPLKEAVVLAQAVATGDLTRAPTATGKDEVAQLMRALGDMVTQLRTVVAEVRGGVESVGTASAEIANGNLDLSQRTEEQASNLQQTSASMEQLTSTVKHNADNARTASKLASDATDVAERGGKAVGEVVTTMEAISDSSKRMSDIIGVIDGIAFQTNILALNAAVEAARAGEQGRGFAVVASEVRSLAQRSAGAAKEIKELIQQSVSRVDGGAKLVAQAGQTMSDVVTQIKRVHGLVGEIATASLQQSQGIEQVGHAVAQLDQVTQQNAALVEQSAAAADSMKQQAQKLAHTMSIFNLEPRARSFA